MLADSGHVGCVGAFEVGGGDGLRSGRRSREVRVFCRATDRAVVAIDERGRQTRRRIGGEGRHQVGVHVCMAL